MATFHSIKPSCKNLVLDAGPLLSLSPLRGLAENYYTVPQVLNELKDNNARQHFEKLGLSAGVRIQVQNPDSASLAHGMFCPYASLSWKWNVKRRCWFLVIQFAKKTGDYSVLSHADICVLALTYGLDTKEKRQSAKEKVAQDELESPIDSDRPSRNQYRKTLHPSQERGKHKLRHPKGAKNHLW